MQVTGPMAAAASSSDSLPAKHFNIFMVDNWNQSEFKQISQLTDLKFGECTFSLSIQYFAFYICKR